MFSIREGAMQLDDDAVEILRDVLSVAGVRATSGRPGASSMRGESGAWRGEIRRDPKTA
jgi:hypothetical protein